MRPIFVALVAAVLFLAPVLAQQPAFATIVTSDGKAVSGVIQGWIVIGQSGPSDTDGFGALFYVHKGDLIDRIDAGGLHYRAGTSVRFIAIGQKGKVGAAVTTNFKAMTEPVKLPIAGEFRRDGANARIIRDLARAEPPSQTKPQWTILSASVQAYTQAEHRDNIDPVVAQGSHNLRVLLSFRYDGPAGEVQAPVLRVVGVAQSAELRVPGNLSVGLADVGSMAWLMFAIAGPPRPTKLESGRAFGQTEPLTYYAVDVPPSVRTVRVIFGDAPPQDVEITQAPKKR